VFNSKVKEVKKRTVKDIFADIDALIVEMAKSGATNEQILWADCGELQIPYELKHAAMLRAVVIRLGLPVPHAHGGLKYSATAKTETR
jgi:hypothetical protein